MSSEPLLCSDSEDSEQGATAAVSIERQNMEARAEHQKTKNYKLLYGVTTTLGVVSIVLILIWILNFRSGFAWSSNPTREFNWHPFLMVTGLLFTYSQSMLIYRTGRNLEKLTLKRLHTLLHLVAFVLSVIGLKAVFDSHNYANPPVANLYTLHSWIGLITVILFAAQFVFGFASFLYPGVSLSLRAAALPVHTSMGIGMYAFALVAALTGLTEKAIWSIGSSYQFLPSEGLLVNFIALILVCFGVLSLYLVSDVQYKRAALPNENLTLTGNSE